MLKKLAILTAIALAIFVVIVSVQPADFGISRKIRIAAPAEVIYPHVNNLHLWDNWSPWAKMDPNSVAAYEGPQQGVGTIMRWSGNHEVGAGSMTITDNDPNRYIAIRLDFIEPMEATNHTKFTFTPEGDSTIVKWTMTGKNSFSGKAASLVFDMEKMIGEQFEKGLKNLKSIAENHVKVMPIQKDSSKE